MKLCRTSRMPYHPMPLLSIVVLLIAGSVSIALAQYDTLVPTGRFTMNWGTTRNMIVHGNYCYLATGSTGLQIVNIQNPTAMRPAGESYAYGYVENIAKVGNYAYITSSDSGFHILDLQNPISPGVVLSDHNRFQFAREILEENGYVYCIEYEGYDSLQLTVLGVSIPSSPQTISTTRYQATEFRGVAVYNQFLYLTNGDSTISIIDARQPTAPVLTIRMRVASWTSSITVAENFAYVMGYEPRFSVLSLTNPASPTIIAQSDSVLGYANLAVFGNRLYSCDNGEEESFLYIYDITNPTQPQFLQQFEDYVFDYAVTSDNSVVFTCGGNVNAYANTNQPQLIGSSRSQHSLVEQIKIRGDRMYLGEWYGMSILSPANPGTLVQIGRIDSITNGQVYHFDFLSDQFIVTACDTTMKVYNISDPAHASLIGSLHFPYFLAGVSVRGNYAYVFGWNDGSVMRVVDLTNPTMPILVGNTFTYDWGSMVFEGNFVYLRGHSQLYILDMSNPVNPVLISSTEISPQQYCTTNDNWAKVGNYVFAAGQQGLSRTNVTNMTSPQYTSDAIPGNFTGVSSSGNYLFGNDYFVGLRVFRIQPNGTAVEVGRSRTWGAGSVLAQDQIAYVSTYNHLLTFDCSHLMDVGDPIGNTALPQSITLHDPYPNPFNAEVSIRFDVPSNSMIAIDVFDALGRQVNELPTVYTYQVLTRLLGMEIDSLPVYILLS
ncbi:MAG: hypothetical protein OEM52_02750 [bacterium]|nr:hypothetical protein [bacterium]